MFLQQQREQLMAGFKRPAYLRKLSLVVMSLALGSQAQSCEDSIDAAQQFSALLSTIEKVLDGQSIKEDALAIKPPKPQGLRVSGAFYNISLFWHWAGGNPGEACDYCDHAFTRIYRSERNDFASAAPIGKSEGTAYSDRVGSRAAYYYWITNVNAQGIEGPPHSCEGEFAQTV